ncbi:hypothetical protein [Escherichia coli]|uniref:hypothetical protein n=1 Tax=Escherichia coli TaxID=562 RepID=UPI001484E53A|nr:hypothetical protein [Escherichia coli]
MGSCAAPSAKGDDKFITTDYLQQCRYQLGGSIRMKRIKRRAVRAHLPSGVQYHGNTNTGQQHA